MAGSSEPRRKWRWRDQIPPVRAARVTRRRRWALRRAGRTDARHGKLPLVLARPGITTEFREGIKRDLLAQIEAARQIYGEWTRKVEWDHEEAQTRVTSLDQQIRLVRAEIEEREKGRPGLFQPAVRRGGEANQREEVVNARRQREFAKDLRPIRERVDALEADAKRQLDRRDDAAARLAAIVAERERVERWISSMQLHARAIYDQALIDRHPHGGHVGPLLDGATLDLPAWPLPDWLTRPPTNTKEAGA